MDLKEFKRQKMVKCCASLMVEGSIRNTCVDSLCHAIGCSKSTFYQFFDNKSIFLRCVFEDISEQIPILMKIDVDPEESVEEELYQLAKNIFLNISNDTSIRLARLSLLVGSNNNLVLTKAFLKEFDNYRLRVSACLELYVNQKRLHIPAIDIAARQFVDLASGDLVQFCVKSDDTHHSREACADQKAKDIARVFLLAYS
ncbi:hypothetical protein A8A54_19205 [Brucella pseudogrignonensis]|uniref:TetR/AcrR family transcriptional regulator n=1 Tax=Brucella pseudogrignonensis TaxID=419475 RepID=UPI0007DA6B49|nr:TetR/AcrR family transcriptional regulator C-terminal domain-containing protein [Brucella pseudogrignonensis]ANG98735.1 hypothetical protein A8A54_19205 [Brucella pseudogrignonensis]